MVRPPCQEKLSYRETTRLSVVHLKILAAEALPSNNNAALQKPQNKTT